MNENPEYWLKRIAHGADALVEVGPACERPGRDEAVADRLVELNTQRLLHKMRKEAGMTQAQVAELLGISRPAATQLENKPTTSMSIGTFARYARACGFRFDPVNGLEKLAR